MNKNTVIFSSDMGELYIPFVEPVTKAWENIGFNVICEIINDKNNYVSNDIIPYANQSQMIRVLLPALHPDTLFIVSDVDMLPLSREYFHKVTSLVDSKNKIVNVSADAYQGQDRFPMCYFAGYGSAFSSVTGIKTREDISSLMQSWWNEGKGWETDELCFTKMAIESSRKSDISLSLYGRGWKNGMAIGRIDRGMWTYDTSLLFSGGYIDSHMLRPLEKYREYLRPLFESVGVTL